MSSVEMVITRRSRDLGGLSVGRVLPFSQRRMVGPFAFVDHLLPATIEAGIPTSMDVRPHPHIGLSTVTYLFEGEIMHRDSVGSEQAIRPGELNWMVAGRGIVHSERLERARREGGRLHAVQVWVALPEADEEREPAFYHHGKDELPTFDEGGVRGRLLAGEALGLKSPVVTHSPMFYLHWELARGASAELGAEHGERAAYVVAGEVEVSGQRYETGQAIVFAPGGGVRLTARVPSTLMAFGGESLGPRLIEWNFVSSSKERIERAKSDWREGRMPMPKNDSHERIPLPSEPAAAANPMS